MKLAILLLCHKGAEQINLFLKKLKHKDVEFYIHVDKKSNISSQLIKRSDIHLLPNEYCIDVRWGEYSEIQATLNLMKSACKEHKFDYYWLCSGQDLPIRSIEEILKYLNDNKGQNFIQLISSANLCGLENSFDKRNILYYPQCLLGWVLIKRILKRLYVEISGGYHNTFEVFRRKDNISKIKSYFGSQWICVTNEFMDWLLKYLTDHSWYEREFSHCSCPDESFFQTLIMLSPYCDTRHDYLHYIDWSERNNNPKVLTILDYKKMKSSKYLMARKFDLNIDSRIIRKLIDE